MKRRLVIVLALVLAGGTLAGFGMQGTGASPATAPAATQPRAQVMVHGIAVQSPEYARAAARFDADRVGRVRTPLILTFHVHSEEKMVLAEIVLDAVTDDTGKSLPPPKMGRPIFLRSAPGNLSVDRHEAFVDAAFNEGPANGAKELTMKGSAKVKLGLGKTTTRTRIPLVTGTALDVAGVQMKIASVTHYSDYVVTFQGKQMPAEMESLVLSNGADTLYAAKPSRIDSFGNETRLLYSLKELPADAEVQVTWFDTCEEIRVPFTVTAGIGY